MARPKRDLRVLNINIPTPLNGEVEAYANKHGMTKTDAVCKLIKESLESQKAKV